MEYGLSERSYDTTIPDERLEQDAKYVAELAYQRIFGDIKSLEHVSEQPSVKKAALIKAKRLPIRGRSSRLARPPDRFVGVARETLTKRLALAGGDVYMGIHVGHPDIDFKKGLVDPRP